MAVLANTVYFHVSKLLLLNDLLRVNNLKLVMVSLLFFKSRFRNKGVMKKSGKRKKRNEIQCIIKVNHWRLFKLSSNNVLFMNLKKKFMITMLANLELIFLLRIIMLEAIIAIELLAIGIAIISHIQS